jgi:branched-chain amino acid aminotransferase
MTRFASAMATLSKLFINKNQNHFGRDIKMNTFVPKFSGMNYYPLHNYFILNGKLSPNTGYDEWKSRGGVYEVLRVTGGKPLFLEEHLERFYQSAYQAGIAIYFTREDIVIFLKKLIAKNDVYEGNIFLSYKNSLTAFFIPHKYPGEELYSKGVVCEILKAERENPNVKILQTDVRRQADEIMELKGVYEVILVDHLGRITEGSRTNVFFVKDDTLITPPADEVLKGITREKTIQLAKEEPLPFIERDIFLKELPSFDAMFITGTSAKILPVSCLGEYKFDPSNRIIKLLQGRYDGLIRQQLG